MTHLEVFETEKMNYAVRPLEWAGIWNKDGKIKEEVKQLGIFPEKEDADKFARWKEMDEKGETFITSKEIRQELMRHRNAIHDLMMKKPLRGNEVFFELLGNIMQTIEYMLNVENLNVPDETKKTEMPYVSFER